MGKCSAFCLALTLAACAASATGRVLAQGISGCAATTCISLYEPVCGADGVTYNNDCEANCRGVTIVSRGACPNGTDGGSGATNGGINSGGDPRGCAAVLCPAIWAPVCGVDNITYSNDCESSCRNVTIASRGACPGSINSGGDPRGCAAVLCSAIWAPVCGVDNITYSNDCESSCRNVTIASRGACPADGSTDDGSTDGGSGATNGGVNSGGDPRGCAAVLCPAIWAPVCGVDNITYSNDCESTCRNVTVASRGECGAPLPAPAGDGDGNGQDEEPPRGCPQCAAEMALPVCDPATSMTYGSHCYARCLGVTGEVTPGMCPDDVHHDDHEGTGDSAGGSASGRDGTRSTVNSGGDPSGCAAVECAAIWAPVCGVDGITYSNDCASSCRNVTIASRGECGAPAPNCTCNSLLPERPVCGSDGKTYAGPCEATLCHGVDVVSQGPCPTVRQQGERNAGGGGCEVCIATYDPVCSTSNVTFSNECWAKCNGTEVAYKGECKAIEGPKLLSAPQEGPAANPLGGAAEMAMARGGAMMSVLCAVLCYSLVALVSGGAQGGWE